jgi:LacI family transcriptional regulator
VYGRWQVLRCRRSSGRIFNFRLPMPGFLAKIPRVLVVLSTVHKARRDKLTGILKYAQLNGPWDVQMVEDHPYIARLGSFKNWRPDGMIKDGSYPIPFRIPKTMKIPTVLLDTDARPCRCTCVDHDSRQTAEHVADYFLRQGLRQFAFVGSVPRCFWSEARVEGFAGRLAENGYPCAIYKPKNAKDWGLEQEHMQRWLLTLPNPCGIMAAMDLRARQVLDACRGAGIRVPEEIAVIGVDNDETICENSRPTLSSVLPDFEGAGYLAAELLDRLMRKIQRKPLRLTYGVKRIVQRQSTQRLQVANGLAASAVEFIRLNACAGITVADVAQHLKVSRRLAELRFREACGRSILEEIRHYRLERVCTLLRETNLPIGEIGQRCGYETETYLKALFKARFGMTMRAYRKAPTPTAQRDTSASR